MNIGAFGENFPYTNFHDLNLDWIIKVFKEMKETIDEGVVHSVNGQDGHVTITGDMIADTLLNISELSQNQSISDYTEEELTTLYNNGIRFLFLLNSANDYDTCYILTYSDDAVHATLYNPAGETAGVLRVNGKSGVVTLYGTDIEMSETENEALYTAIKNRKQNDKYIFIGDSYGTGHGPDENVNSWIIRCANALGLEHEVNYWYNATDGASWAGLNSRPSFLTVLQGIENDITEPEKITRIVVAGGVNDASGTVSQLLAGLSNFSAYAKQHYPNAEIYVAEIGWVRNAGRAGIYTISEIGYSRCGAYGMHYIPHGNLPMHQYDNFQSDGVHPNSAGASCIGWAMASALSGGSFNFNSSYTFYYNLDPAIFSTVRTLSIIENIAEGELNIVPKFAGNLFLTENHPLVAFTKYRLATENANQYGYVQSLDDTAGALVLDALLTYNDGTTHQYIIKCIITFEGKDIYFKPIFSPYTIPDSATKSIQFLYNTCYIVPHMYF